MRESLPRSARRWGLARKVLNIFLRDSLYTVYVNEACGLHRAERHFEIPLDSLTAKAIRAEAGRGVLPKWPGVRGLTPSISTEYQRVASKVARRERNARVHLDAVYWSAARNMA